MDFHLDETPRNISINNSHATYAIMTAHGQQEDHEEEAPIRNSSSISVSHLVNDSQLADNSGHQQTAEEQKNLDLFHPSSNYHLEKQPSSLSMQDHSNSRYQPNILMDMPAISIRWPSTTRQLPHPYQYAPGLYQSSSASTETSTPINTSVKSLFLQQQHSSIDSLKSPCSYQPNATTTSPSYMYNSYQQPQTQPYLHPPPIFTTSDQFSQFSNSQPPSSNTYSSNSNGSSSTVLQAPPSLSTEHSSNSRSSIHTPGSSSSNSADKGSSSGVGERLSGKSESTYASRSSAYQPETRSFKLTICQDPVRVRVCGFGDKDRRPIDPPPIIQLRIFDKDGRLIHDPHDLHFFIAHAALVAEDGRADISVTKIEDTEIRLLMGSLVSSINTFTDLDGQLGYFFAFPDLSIRTEGTYRLKFSVVNIGWSEHAQPGSTSNVLCSVLTNVFRAYTAKKFPGMLESSDLMKHFARQGLKLVIRKDLKGRREDEDECC